ncbi:hypothetical protein H8K52_07590 [Undibacterium seohonense]|uniref:Alkaline phytoceramidase n=1 Tax=Undibacterium seohonense TaxID=1344950 RepID=A0ABR6X325_9BURK|nr:hypothetical protein [Undibacterium seohonense]MBC3807207.1 hypothetical protein [Undibacterium seohonense]
MTKKWRYLPLLIVGVCTLLMLMHGTIQQYADYHVFADTSAYWTIPNALDVLSNLAFAVIGLLGLFASRAYFHQRSSRRHPKDYAYLCFVLSIFATSVGSTFYHLAPDDARLFWDRLPIALACATLIAAVRTECFDQELLAARRDLIALIAFATASVLWWQQSGDLRPYLALQLMAIILIPLWQGIYAAPKRTRWIYAAAIACYVLAKVCEIGDAAILLHTGLLSGHTIKHLLASAAAALIIWHWLHPKFPSVGRSSSWPSAKI